MRQANKCAQRSITFEFPDLLAMKIRSMDGHGVWKNISDTKLIEKFFIRKKDEKREVDIFERPTDEMIGKLRLFYETVALSIEYIEGVYANTVIDIKPEGFGQVLIVNEQYVLMNISVRNIQKFGFESIEKLKKEADRLVEKGVTTYQGLKAANCS